MQKPEFEFSDRLAFKRTVTSEIEVTLSGLSLGTFTLDEFRQFREEILKFEDESLTLVKSPKLLLPHRRQQERIIAGIENPPSTTPPKVQMQVEQMPPFRSNKQFRKGHKGS